MRVAEAVLCPLTSLGEHGSTPPAYGYDSWASGTRTTGETSQARWGTSYQFPDQQGRQCFAPCESQHNSCHTHCSLLTNEPLLSLACHLDCNMAVERCASSCGGWKGSPASPPTVFSRDTAQPSRISSSCYYNE